MNNYQADLVSAANEVAVISRGLLPAEELEKLLAEVAGKTADLRPGIMFYGVYNAGKSTLLNALLGEERASVADKPETCAVTEYLWNGYRVFDSPGIDAPSEHEAVSRDHLKRVEVVLFVVSSNGVFEERSIYQEIGRIAGSGKPVILVLNNKSGLEPGSAALAEIEAKVQQNLLKYGDAGGSLKLEEIVSTVIVNAKSALKARLEHKSLLLEKSNLCGLEAAIKRQMAKTSAMDSVRTVVAGIDQVIIKGLTAIDDCIKSADASGVGSLRSQISDQKMLFLSRTRSLVAGEINQICQKVRALIEAQSGENAINSAIENWLQELTDRLQALQDIFLADIEGRIERELETHSGIEAARPDLAGVGQEGGAGKGFQNIIEEQVRNALKGVKEGHLKDVLLTMRKLKVPGLKGRWESTLGRWAGKSLPYVQVVLALWELWSGYQEDEGARDKVRQQVMQTNRAVDELRVNLKRSLDEQLDCWMSQIDGELNNLFNATASGVKDEIDALIGKQAGLNGIRERLDRLSA